MRKLLTIVLVTALFTGTAGAVRAGEQSQSGKLRDQAEEAFREGTRKFMKALDLMLRSVPQYAAPEINENGDIVIRRIRPRPPKFPDQSRPDESTT